MSDVHVPKMGMSTVEVEVTAVYVEAGQRVKAGDELVQVEGDKVTFVVEAEQDGTVVEVLVEAGVEYQVGDVLLRLADG